MEQPITTETIRRRATEPRYERYDRRKRIVKSLESDFDAWYAEEIRKAKEQAWDDGYEAGAEDQAEVEGHRHTPGNTNPSFNHWSHNPYRKD